MQGSTVSAAAAILISLLALPLIVDRAQFNTADLSPQLQAWRAKGQFYIHHRYQHFLICLHHNVLPKTDMGCTACRELGDAAIFHVDDAAVSGNIAGSKTLLLLHGFPSASFDFSGKFWNGLHKQYDRIIALDFLGYGFSDKPRLPTENFSMMTQADIVEGLLWHLHVTDTHVLAHDVGDTVAQELLARFNDRVHAKTTGVKYLSLCFLNGGLFPEQHRASTTQKLLNSFAGPYITATTTSYSNFKRTFSPVFGPQTQPSEPFLKDIYDLLAYNGGNLVLHKLIKYINERRANRDRWVGALSDSQCRIGLINGPADPISGKHAAEYYLKTVPNPWVRFLPGHIGHYPQIEAPDAVLQAYQEFVQHL